MSKVIETPEQQRAKVTPEKVLKRVKKIAKKNPERKNPLVGPACAYTSHHNSTLHCIAGEYLAIYDPAMLPDIYSPRNTRVLIDSLLEMSGYSNGVLHVLGHIQSYADNLTHADKPWSKIPFERVEKIVEIYSEHDTV